MADSIICDTSVWLYLGRIGKIDLLDRLYPAVYTTETVCWELDNGRLNRGDTANARAFPWVRIVRPEPQAVSDLPANRLGPGERSVLAYAYRHQIQVVGLDDRQARNMANRLGLHVTGTLGVLLKARQAGLVSSIRPLLQSIQVEGFHVSEALVQFMLRSAGEE